MQSKEGQFSPLKTSQVLDEVFREREKQDQKWGQQNHRPAFWLMVLGEEVGEANKAAIEAYVHNNKPVPANTCVEKDNFSAYRQELVQVAAVAVAMIESLDRNGV